MPLSLSHSEIFHKVAVPFLASLHHLLLIYFIKAAIVLTKVEIFMEQVFCIDAVDEFGRMLEHLWRVVFGKNTHKVLFHHADVSPSLCLLNSEFP